jgi:hypothetical protein
MKTGLSIHKLLTRAPSSPLRSLACPYNKEEDCLTIDCSRCDGAQDLGQPRCLRGCVRAVSEAGDVERISLSRETVIEYRGRSVVALQKMAVPLARSRAIGSRNSRKCSKCPIEPSRLIEQLYANWPPKPRVESFKVQFHRSGEDQCVSCRNRTLAAMEAANKEFSAINQQLNQLAVKVLGAGR